MSYKLTLGLLALVIITLGGCKNPAGEPSIRVHAATLDTLVIPITADQYLTGDVHHYRDNRSPGGWYSTDYQDTIKWGYITNTLPVLYNDWRGFATFSVPPFSSSQYLPVCTLYYHVSGCYQSQGDSIYINRFVPSYWTWPSESLFKAIDTSSASLAKDVTPTDTGWRKVALTTQGCGIIGTLGARADSLNETQFLSTGWEYLNGPQNGWYTEVTGSVTGVAPYIVVIYSPDP
jgi:hypothetical protein